MSVLQYQELINANSSAATGVLELRWGPQGAPFTLFAYNMGSGDSGDLQVSYDNGSNWCDVYESGTQVQLTSTNNLIQLTAPGLYRVNYINASGQTVVIGRYI